MNHPNITARHKGPGIIELTVPLASAGPFQELASPRARLCPTHIELRLTEEEARELQLQLDVACTHSSVSVSA